MQRSRSTVPSKAIAKAAIDRVPGLYRLMGIPSAAIDYFIHPTSYATDSSNATMWPVSTVCFSPAPSSMR